MGDFYADLEILAAIADDDYLIRISKADLNTLVTFSENLVVRHWDGEKLVVLENYGESFVRSKEDADSDNNLQNLPKVGEDRLVSLLEKL